ncbi:polysaccharide pyruvyl transferase family protein [Glaciecola siphonariae]|uniref:Polysaccharide pyruvyl transferase family protein n=1 Tax=Glaciecola siphonariae TaxID=521012 RepID=A0ABV9LZ26_9ALTE
MKYFLKSLIVLLYTVLVKLMRIFTKPSQVFLICPPFPNNINIGDRGLVLGALCELYKYEDDVVLVQMTDSYVQEFPEFPNLIITDKHTKLFKVNRDLASSLTWLFDLKTAKRVHLIGADSIDDYYSRSDAAAKMYAAELAGRLGIKTNVMSFSINEVSDALKQRVSELTPNVHLVARDPVSFERLQKANIERIHCSADLSYLFEPSAIRDDANLHEFLNANAGNILGFSFNNLLFSANENNDARFDFYAQAIYELAIKAEKKVLFIPNNDRDAKKYGEAIHQRIVEKAPSLSYFSEYLGDPSELKALMSKCYYYFSTTLHMGLFPIGVGVPTTCFPYAGKFDGPLQLLDSIECQIKPDDIPSSPTDFARMMYEHLSAADFRKKNIEANLPKVKTLAKINLQDF